MKISGIIFSKNTANNNILFAIMKNNQVKQKKYFHKFSSLKIKMLFLAGVVIFFGGISNTASASVSYNLDTNTIFLEDGTNTLASICGEINDESVLDYDGGANTYTLSANISGKNGVLAHLHLKDTTLVFNNSTDNKYYIKTWADLVIENMTIKAADPLYPWLIHAFAKYTEYSIKITDCDISGGQIQGAPNGYQEPRIPTIIRNNNFHDTTFENNNDIGGCLLRLSLSSAVNAEIYNNTFENIHIRGPFANPHPGILYLNSYSGCKVEKIYFFNCSIESTSQPVGGMITFYGTSPGTITDFEIKDCIGWGLEGKEYGNVVYSNGTITNITKAGIFLYHSKTYENTNFWIWNIVMNEAAEGIRANTNSWITADIYNVKINNAVTVFSTGLYSLNSLYITNSKAVNYTTLYSVPSGEIREYQLADIYAVDTNGNPIENTMLTIEADNPDVDNCVINRNLESLAQTTTLSNGHTPLPNENNDNTVALLRLRKTSTTEKSDYSYTITAEKDGYTTMVAGINPDETWYREDPNTYQNTITIILDMEEEDTTPPNTSNHNPIKNATSISKDTNITLHIQDTGDGVDQSSIIMTVEGETVIPTITGTSADYTLTYNPPIDFDYDQVIDITIDAQDLASTPNVMTTESYLFTIESDPTSPNIILQKQVDKSEAETGETLTYTITYTNTGDAQATNIIITDNIPTNTTYIDNSATGSYTYDSDNKILTWTIDTLESEASGSVSFQVGIDEGGIGMNVLDEKHLAFLSAMVVGACPRRRKYYI